MITLPPSILIDGAAEAQQAASWQEDWPKTAMLRFLWSRLVLITRSLKMST